MEPRCPRWLLSLRAVLSVLAISVIGVSVPGVPASAHEADGQPARIHSGSCGSFQGVVYLLTGVGADTTRDGTPVPLSEQVGLESAFQVARSETSVPVPLSEIVEDEHAIVVYESDEAMDRVIACGNVGGLFTGQMPGVVMPGDELAVVLAEQDGSGFSGIAMLTAAGRSTEVHLNLADGLARGARGEDVDHHDAPATPVGG